MNKKTLLIFFFCMFFVGSPCFAATVNYYVDCDAGGGANGSLGSPWKNIADINWRTLEADAAGGDDPVVNLKRDCTWNAQMNTGGSGTEAHYIVVKAYGTGNNPKLDRNGAGSCLKIDENYIKFYDLDIEDGGHREGSFVHFNGARYVELHRMTVTDVDADAHKAVHIEASSHILISHCIIDTDSWNNSGAGNIVPGHDSDHVTVEYTISENGVDGLVTSGSDDLIIRYSTFRNNWRENGIDIKRTERVQIYGNKVYGSEDDNINIQNSWNIDVYNNEVYDSKSKCGIKLTEDATKRDDKFTNTKQIHIWGNEVYQNSKDGFNILISTSEGTGFDHITVNNNTFHHNGARGINIPGAEVTNLKVENNSLYGNGSGDPPGGSVTIYPPSRLRIIN